MLEDRRGGLWFKGKDFGAYAVHRYDGTSFQTFTVDDGLVSEGILGSDKILVAFEDREGRIWFGHDSGVTKYDQKSPVLQNFTPRDALGINLVDVIFEDRQGAIWFSVPGRGWGERGVPGGVARYDGEKMQYFSGRQMGWKDGNTWNIMIIAMLDDGKGGVWFLPGGYQIWDDGRGFERFGRASHPIDLFLHSGGRFRRHRIKISIGDGWIGGEWFKPTIDSEGNLWVLVGSPKTGGDPVRLDGKPAFLTDEGWKKTHMADGEWKKMKMAGGKTTDIHVDQKGNIWFATREGIKRYDGKSLKTFTAEEVFRSGTNISPLDIWKIFEDKQGNLWFAGSKALIKYDGKSFESFPVYVTSPPTLIHQDAHDVISFIYAGMSITHGWVRPKILDYPLGEYNNRFFPSEIKRGGRSGLGWFYAIGRYDGRDFQLSRLGAPEIKLPVAGSPRQWWSKVNQALEEALSSGLRTFATDRKGNLWLATTDGAIKYDGKEFTTYTTNNGFPINDVRDVLVDKRGHVWFATWGGGVVHYDGTTFQPITTKDGLIHNNVRNIFEDSRGHLWFATNGGITRYTPTGAVISPTKKLSD